MAVVSALAQVYPGLRRVTVTECAIQETTTAAANVAAVRTLLTVTAGNREWRTVGCAADPNDALWLALIDGVEYALLEGVMADV